MTNTKQDLLFMVHVYSTVKSFQLYIELLIGGIRVWSEVTKGYFNFVIFMQKYENVTSNLSALVSTERNIQRLIPQWMFIINPSKITIIFET